MSALAARFPYYAALAEAEDADARGADVYERLGAWCRLRTVRETLDDATFLDATHALGASESRGVSL